MSEQEKTFSTASPADQTSVCQPPLVAPNTPVLGSTVNERPKVRPKTRRALKPATKHFVTLYATPNQPAFGNASEAYQRSHPNCKSRVAAATKGSETVRRADVQDELESMGWTKARLEAELARNVRKCWEKERLGDHRESALALAKLAGHLVDRQEVTNMTNEQREAIRRAVAENLSTPN